MSEGATSVNDAQLLSAFSSFLGNIFESAEVKKFTAKFQTYHNQVMLYESPSTLNKALSIIPVNEIKQNAEKKMKEEMEEGAQTNVITLEQECLLKALMYWFKFEFFSWVDAPPCEHCRSKNTKMQQMNVNERGERVEMYICSECSKLTAFPRHNNPEILLTTRRGRCGEWANCFTLCCRAMGFPARLILDFTDHVWTEVFIGDRSTGEGDWYHCDACENKFNTPLLYERGWKKSLSYVFAFSQYEVKDVILRYTNKMGETLKKRTEIAEDHLKIALAYFNQQTQNTLPASTKQLYSKYNEAEEKFFQLKLQSPHNHASPQNAEEEEGRISGSKAWRQARGEIDGNNNNDENENVSLAILSSLRFEHVVFEFSSFQPSARTLIFNGDCKLIHSYLQLTDKQNDQRGSVWFIRKLPIDRSFKVKFQYQISNAGADGFAFVIQNEGEKALGTGGGHLGYGGIKKSVAIEFDMYDNFDINEDPNGNHISIHTRGQLANSPHHKHSLICAENLPFQMSDQKLHSVEITYFHSDDNNIQSFLCLFMDGQLILNTHLNLPQLLNNNNNNNNNNDNNNNNHNDNNEYWFGFTAATGGLSQEHKILHWGHYLLK